MDSPGTGVVATVKLQLDGPDPELLTRMVDGLLEQGGYSPEFVKAVRPFVVAGAGLALNAVTAAFDALDPEEAEQQIRYLLEEARAERE